MKKLISASFIVFLKINDNAIYMLILACTFWIVKTLEDNKGN